MVKENARVHSKIPELFSTLMEPHLEKVDEAISPGLTVLRWTSLNIEPFLESIYSALRTVELLIDRVVSIHENRIEVVFADMLLVPLCEIPTNSTLTIDEFCTSTSALCSQASGILETKSRIVEQAVKEVVDLLLSSESVIEKVHNETAPGAKALQRKRTQQNKLKQESENLMLVYEQKNIDVFLQLTRVSMEGLRKRLMVASLYGEQKASKGNIPLFQSDILLVLPTITMSPSLDEIQQGLNQAVSCIALFTKTVYRWWQERPTEDPNSSEAMSPDLDISNETHGRNRSGRVKFKGTLAALKNYHQMVAEHKEVAKLISLLSTAVNSTKNIISQGLAQFDRYRVVWEVEKEQRIAEFMKEDPGVNDFRGEMQHYMQLEEVNKRRSKLQGGRG